MLAYGLVYCLLNAQILLWVFDQWIRTDYGVVGAGFFVAGCCVLLIRRRALVWNARISLPFLLVSLGFLAASTGVLPLGYNILRSICFVLGLLTGCSAFVPVSRKQFLLLASWLLSCLPVVPLLGSTVGLVNREVYASLLHVFFSGAQRIGTSFYDGGYAFHIDAGCSGVQGMYFLWGAWNVIAMASRDTAAVRFRVLAEALTLFWFLNGARVVFLYVLHNLQHVSALNSLDLLAGIMAFGIALSFVVLRMTLPYRMPR